MKKNKIHNIVSAKLGLAMLMLFGVLSMAKAQETLTVSPVEIVPGEEAEVTVAYESTVDRKSFQMNITLPQGLTYVESEENGKIVKLGDAASDHLITEVKESESLVRIIAFSMTSAPFASGKNLISFKVKAGEDLAASSQIELSNLKFAGGEYIEGLTGSVTRTMGHFDMTGVTPDTAVVQSGLSEVVITMGSPVGGVAEGAKAVVTKDGTVVEEAPIAFEAGSADVKIVLSNEITESGVYTLTIAEGVIFDEKYEAADPIMSGAKSNNAIALDFKVMGHFDMTGVTPDTADVHNSLSEVVITMGASVGGVAEGAKAVVTKDGAVVEEAPLAFEAGSADVKVVLSNEITESGVYTLTIAEGVIFDEKYEAADPIMSGAKSNNAIALDFKVMGHFDMTGVTPDTADVHNSLSEVVITMGASVGGVAEGAKAVVTKDGAVVEEAPLAFEAGSADVKVILAYEITESGVYTLTIAEGVIFDEKYDAADPIMSGAKCNNEIVLEFEVYIYNGINGINVKASDKDEVYTLGGVRVNGKLSEGIYIINGKKVVIKR